MEKQGLLLLFDVRRPASARAIRRQINTAPQKNLRLQTAIFCAGAQLHHQGVPPVPGNAAQLIDL
jgi:hypothetical protein